ncbi:TATA element modulatory factor 1 TATA binding-domain-containing protein [Absidia repens]|uniref:TATA element modulatory factor 1 TATA binding-domain-containing protein n=1 Tax=Absidia repens TaxID=90262 RepID=A0A1X2I4X9_9FUNG|nr:TATA element modulatory factor 1 TATA binding-domain-containing protein [Absidia repens]
MSFFGGNNQWGGLLKQAISNVETTFDTLLEQPESARTGNQDEETETYMDPISGMVTTVPKKKRGAPNATATATATTTSSISNSRPSTPKQSTATEATLQRQQSDLSARLAAVMNEKKARSSTSSSRPTSIHSSQSVEPSSSSASVHQQGLSTPTPTADSENGDNHDGPVEPSDEKLANKIDESKNTLSTRRVSLENVADSNEVNSDSSTNVDNDDKCSNASKGEKENDPFEDLNDINASPPSHKKGDDDVGSSNNQPRILDHLDTTETTTDSKSSTLDGEYQTKDIKLDDDDDNDDTDLEGPEETHLEPFTQDTAQQRPAETDEPTSTNVLPTDVSGTSVDSPATSTEDDNNKKTSPIFDDDINSTLAPVPPSSAYSSNTTSNQPVTSETHAELDEKNNTTTIATSNKSDKDRILAQREQQLLQAMETIAKLHDQIHGLQQDGDQATAHINSLQKRLQDQSTSQASTRNVKKLELSIQDMTKQLDSKEEQIQGLLKEGEKLSKNELKQTTTIKRLRTEKQDQDKTLTDIQKKLDKANADLVDITAKSKRASEGEKRAQDSIKMLTEMTERQTKHINKLETDSMHLKEQYQHTQAELATTLENLEKEKNKAKVESEQVHAAALEKEVAANGRLHKELTTTKDAAQALETKLRTEIRELQIALQSSESQAGQREDNLRREVADVQMQLQKRDAHFDDISSNVEEATTPLLRQIEELQTQHSLVIKNRDQAEQSMNLRLQHTEKEYKQATDQLKTFKNEVQELKDELADHRQRMEGTQQEKRNLKTRLESIALEVEALQTQLKERQQKLDDQKAHEAKTIDDVKKQYQKLMRERLQEEKKMWDAKNQQQRQQKQVEQELASKKLVDTSSASPPFASGTIPTSPRKEDTTSVIFKRSETHSPSTSARSSIDSGYTGVLNQPSYTPSTLGTDRMQMTIRQMENQLSFYQTQLQIATQSRDELSDELATMSQEMETLRDECRKMNSLQKEHDDINRRYQASLELLGERTEQVEELRADIADVKDMYRTQIVEMVQKIDQLSSNQK